MEAADAPSGAVHIVAGGTVSHVRPHLALAAVAYGGTGRRLDALCREHAAARGLAVHLHLTRMASGGAGRLETNDDIAALLRALVDDPATRMIFLPAALCDFDAQVVLDGVATPRGKDQPRLASRAGAVTLALTPAEKVIGQVRRARKDIFLVGFKTTAGATADAQYLAGLELLKRTSCNLVLANDLHARRNMVVAPELARYGEGTDREAALRELVEMAFLRAGLSFTRTTVEPGELVAWDSPAVPGALRAVVEHCVARGAYKPFRGVTVGHFAYREAPGVLLSSRRKRDFNRREDRDLVRVRFDGDAVIAHGARPSAGARSQYTVLAEHPEFDCIVHFHCPAREGSRVPVRPQRAYECGSHECGRNTSDGMHRFGNVAAVMLDRHGPNVIFRADADPAEVTRFIDANFDLTARTDGLTDVPQ